MNEIEINFSHLLHRRVFTLQSELAMTHYWRSKEEGQLRYTDEAVEKASQVASNEEDRSVGDCRGDANWSQTNPTDLPGWGCSKIQSTQWPHVTSLMVHPSASWGCICQLLFILYIHFTKKILEQCFQRKTFVCIIFDWWVRLSMWCIRKLKTLPTLFLPF